MSIRPRLVSNVPFWILLAGSLISLIIGVWIAVPTLGVMVRTLTDQSATGVEVYAGQSYVLLGAVLIGAGVIGLALSATVAALSGLRPLGTQPQPISWAAEEDIAVVTETVVEPTPDAPEAPVADAAPADDAEAPAAAKPASDDENATR